MDKWIVTMAMACLGSFCGSAEAAELLELEAKDLALPWNAKPAELQNSFPGLRELSSHSCVYRGPVSVGPLTYEEEMVFFDFDKQSGGLNRIFVGLPGTDSVELVKTLKAKLGAGRWANYWDGGVFQHVYEWTAPSFTLQFAYASDSAVALSKAATGFAGQLKVLRDKPRVSSVDQALEYPK